MAPKTKLIFNPIANLGRAWPVAASLRPLVNELGGADWSGTVYPTHAAELARQAGEQGYELVVAMGGDGTVHEVVNGLMQLPRERRPRMGVVPVGTGNDLAHALGVSNRPEEAIRQVLNGVPRPLDVGLLQGESDQKEYWVNTVGIGFDTIVTIRSRKVPIFQGFAVYFAAVLQTILLNHDPFRIQVTTDRETWQDESLMLVLCNGMREGGGFLMAPQADPRDGLLHLVEVRKISRLQMLATIPYFLNATHPRLPYVRTAEFQTLEIESNRPLYVHTDGEIIAGLGSDLRRLSVRVLHGALETVS
ncbi:MAG TPA: diacylglycerol kinase family protein [Anaerolineaceae bacterium]|nr:diacylglycerol kinase family protein [Anaerolineaceae bacterium]